MLKARAASLHSGSKSTATLGQHLAAIRDNRGLSLRQVEELSKGAVSNAYLSQIETGKILQPSPNILHTLAGIYKISYGELMRMAGYISVPASNSMRSARFATLASLNVSAAEEMELVQYLKFKRSTKE
jgi:transcriptional regulator with XRE-family HTH domain